MYVFLFLASGLSHTVLSAWGAFSLFLCLSSFKNPAECHLLREVFLDFPGWVRCCLLGLQAALQRQGLDLWPQYPVPGVEEVSVKGAEQCGCWTWVFRPEGSPGAIRLPARRSGEVSSNHWPPAPHSPASLVHRQGRFSLFDGCPPNER